MATWIGAKISALGERVVDSVLDAVASNQEQHLQQLQQLQHWTVARLLNRVVNAKYFYKQANVAPCEAFLELHDSSRREQSSWRRQASAASGQKERGGAGEAGGEGAAALASVSAVRPWLPSIEPLGEVCVTVDGATGLLFLGEGGKASSLLQRRQQQQQQLTWLVRVRFENSTKQSLGARLRRRDGGTGSSSFGFNELQLADASFSFPVRDLWSDVLVELLCLRPKTHIIIKPSRDASAGGGAAAAARQEAPVSHLQGPLPNFSAASAALAAGKMASLEREALQGMAGGRAGGAAEESLADVAKRQKGAVFPGTTSSSSRGGVVGQDGPVASTPRGSEEPQVYGRVIIPLSSFLRGKEARDGVVEETLWTHLLPANEMQADPKFFRPVKGFEDFGMKNPQSSLGFLRLTLRFKWKTSPMLSALLSVTSPPASLWLVPPSPEPQYLYSFALRLKHWMHRTPLWRRKILNLADGEVPRNKSDWTLAACWWLLCLYTCCFAPLAAVPFSLAALVACISLTYKFGAAESGALQPPQPQQPRAREAMQDSAPTSFSTESGLRPGSKSGDGNKAPKSSASAEPLPWPRAESFFSHESTLNWSSALWPVETPEAEAPETGAGDASESPASREAADGEAATATRTPSVQEAPLPEEAALLSRLRHTDGGGALCRSESLTGEAEASLGEDDPRSLLLRSKAKAASQPSLPLEGREEEGVDCPSGTEGAFSDADISQERGAEDAGSVTGEGNATEAEKSQRASEDAASFSGLELRSREPSSVQSPFGDLKLLPEGSPRAGGWPVFADDEQELSLAAQIQDVVELATFLQLGFGHLAMALDKIKFAFNWSDPLLTSASVALLLANGLALSVAIKICSLVPLFFWRWGLFAAFAAGTALRDPGTCERLASLVLRRKAHRASSKASFCKRTSGLSTQSSGRRSAEGEGAAFARMASPLSDLRCRRAASSTRPGGDARCGESPSRSGSGCSRRQTSLSRTPRSEGGQNRVLLLWTPLRAALCLGILFASLLQRFLLRPAFGLLRSAALSYGALLCFWWLHLPDQREVEHRQIAASQVLPSLEALIPTEETPDGPPSDTAGGEASSVVASKLLSPSVLSYLKRYFRARWERENPLYAQLYAAAPYLRPRSRSSSVGSSSAAPPLVQEGTTNTTHPSEESLVAAGNTLAQTASADFSVAHADGLDRQGHSLQTDGRGENGEEASRETCAGGGVRLESQTSLLLPAAPQDLQSREKGALRSLASLTAEGSVSQLADHPAFLELRRRLKVQQRLEQRQQQRRSSACDEDEGAGNSESRRRGDKEDEAIAKTTETPAPVRPQQSGGLSGFVGAIPGLEFLFARKKSTDDGSQEEASNHHASSAL